MPLIYKEHTKQGSLVGIWKIEEPAEFFLAELSDKAMPEDKLQTRRLEKLGIRYLLNQLSQKFLDKEIDYDNFGKPHLLNGQHFISFSHKKSFVAVILSENNPHTGIDIELTGPLPLKLSHKFVSSYDSIPEDKFTPQQKAALIWSAKESLYKIYGIKELDFIKHLRIEYIEGNQLLGTIHKNDFYLQVPLKFDFVGDLVLVHSF